MQLQRSRFGVMLLKTPDNKIALGLWRYCTLLLKLTSDSQNQASPVVGKTRGDNAGHVKPDINKVSDKIVEYLLPLLV